MVKAFINIIAAIAFVYVSESVGTPTTGQMISLLFVGFYIGWRTFNDV